jgi:phage recombination protein Bet
MSAELALVSDAPLVTATQLTLIKETIAKDATDAELQLFFFDCQRRGVHPLDRLIHFTKRAGKYTPITSIDFMRGRAAATGECAGIDDAHFSGTLQAPDFAATLTVWRLVQGQRCAFTATAYYREYKPDQNDFMWKKMPHVMLGKVAEALALRKGFPQQLAGLYAAEEFDQAGDAETPRSSKATATISDAQRKRLFAIAKKAGVSNEDLKEMAGGSTKALTPEQYDNLCATLEETREARLAHARESDQEG